MGQVEVEPGVRLYVEQWGDGRPVVLIHGGAMTHAFWEHQVAALMGGFRTITFDLRGCGASDRPSSEYSIDVFARDLHGLVEALELDRPIVVAHALGTHVALQFAADHPELVERLVLVSGAPWGTGDRGRAGGFADAFVDDLRTQLTTNRPQAELDLADREYFHRDPGEGMRMWSLNMALQWTVPVYLQLLESFANVDHRDRLPGLDVPTLVVHGRHDTKNRYEGGVYLAEHLPDARLVTFEDSAHSPPVEEVARFNEVLLEFLVGERATPAAA